MTAVLAILIGLQGAAILAMAMRLSGLKESANKAENERLNAEKQLQETSREFAAHRARSTAHLASIRGDVETLEKDLDACTVHGARRTRIERLLSKASARSHGDG